MGLTKSCTHPFATLTRDVCGRHLLVERGGRVRGNGCDGERVDEADWSHQLLHSSQLSLVLRVRKLHHQTGRRALDHTTLSVIGVGVTLAVCWTIQHNPTMVGVVVPGDRGRLPPSPKFQPSEKFFHVGIFSPKSTKFGAENLPF